MDVVIIPSSIFTWEMRWNDLGDFREKSKCQLLLIFSHFQSITIKSDTFSRQAPAQPANNQCPHKWMAPEKKSDDENFWNKQSTWIILNSKHFSTCRSSDRNSENNGFYRWWTIRPEKGRGRSNPLKFPAELENSQPDADAAFLISLRPVTAPSCILNRSDFPWHARLHHDSPREKGLTPIIQCLLKRRIWERLRDPHVRHLIWVVKLTGLGREPDLTCTSPSPHPVNTCISACLFILEMWYETSCLVLADSSWDGHRTNKVSL
jgi:hypothetical protein